VAHQTVLYGPLAGCAIPEERRQDPGCPVEATLDALRGRWTPLILQEFLRGGGLGFSELAAALPALSAKVLTERLTQLTDAGVLDRTRTAAWPPRVRYTLTERGRDLAPVLKAMWAWGSAAPRPDAPDPR
jgi:DNA-binding HxlR family transcriptional regulator